MLMTSRSLLLLLLSRPLWAADPTAAADPVADVDPIDFELAMRTARASLKEGQSVDEAVEMAERVLSGEVPFELIRSPTGGDLAWLYAKEWLAETDARVLQHEVVSYKGWPVWHDLDGPRKLELREPLPAWALEMAERLAPTLGGSIPDCCVVHACEAGQRACLSLNAVGGGATAVLLLGSQAALLSASTDDNDVVAPEDYPFPSRTTVPLDPRSVLLLREPRTSHGWGHCLHSGGRCIALVFTCGTAHAG